jgi:protease-4
VLLCRGKFAEILADSRPFTPEESELFDRSAQHAYESFRDKAAGSRGMPVEVMQVGSTAGCAWVGA